MVSIKTASILVEVIQTSSWSKALRTKIITDHKAGLHANGVFVHFFCLILFSPLITTYCNFYWFLMKQVCEGFISYEVVLHKIVILHVLVYAFMFRQLVFGITNRYCKWKIII